jgi:hypothetical protein
MIAMSRVGEEELEPNTELLELQASHIWFNKAGRGHSYGLYTVKKRFADFPSPDGMSHLPNFPWPGYLFPARESLESDIPAEDRKISNFFSNLSGQHQ